MGVHFVWGKYSLYWVCRLISEVAVGVGWHCIKGKRYRASPGVPGSSSTEVSDWLAGKVLPPVNGDAPSRKHKKQRCTYVCQVSRWQWNSLFLSFTHRYTPTHTHTHITAILSLRGFILTTSIAMITRHLIVGGFGLGSTTLGFSWNTLTQLHATLTNYTLFEISESLNFICASILEFLYHCNSCWHRVCSDCGYGSSGLHKKLVQALYSLIPYIGEAKKLKFLPCLCLYNFGSICLRLSKSK